MGNVLYMTYFHLLVYHTPWRPAGSPSWPRRGHGRAGQAADPRQVGRGGRGRRRRDRGGRGRGGDAVVPGGGGALAVAVVVVVAVVRGKGLLAHEHLKGSHI